MVKPRREPTIGELRRRVPSQARAIFDVAVEAGFTPRRNGANHVRLVRGGDIVPLDASNLGAFRSRLRRAGVPC